MTDYSVQSLIIKCKALNKQTKKHSVGKIPKSNIKIVEKGKIDTPNTHIHDRSLPWLGTGTSIKSGGVNFIGPNLRS